MPIDLTRVYIKRYIQERLKMQGTIAGDNVFLNRPVNYELEYKDAEIRILSLNSASDLYADAPRIYKRVYTLGIEIAYAPDIANYDLGEDNFENLVAQVEAAIEANEHLDSPEVLQAARIPAEDFCISDTYLKNIEYRTETEGAKPIYVALINYDVCYFYKTGPTTAELDDLETISTDTSPSDGTPGTPSLDSTIDLRPPASL